MDDNDKEEFRYVPPVFKEGVTMTNNSEKRAGAVLAWIVVACIAAILVAITARVVMWVLGVEV